MGIREEPPTPSTARRSDQGYYFPSKKSFKVTKKDLSIFESPLKCLERKLDLERYQEHLQRMFDNAISAALSTLDNQERPEDEEESEGLEDKVPLSS